MIKGTTAPFTFRLPYKKSEIALATIKFWQDGYEGNKDYGSLPIYKKLEDCFESDDPNELCVILDVNETMRFSDKFKAKTLLRAQATDGIVFASQEELITVYPMDDDMIEAPPMPPEDEEGWIVLDGETIA